jgi:transcriptional regulator PpsR
MWSEDFGARRNATRDVGVADEDAAISGADAVSSRGTKYWNSGAIPLIGPDVLGDIIANASDIAVVISDVGQILSVLVNPHHSGFGRLDSWEGRDIREFLTSESVPKLERQLADISHGQGSGRPIELNHSDELDWEFPIRYTLHRIGPDGTLLLLGRDLRPIAEMQQQLVKAQMALERDYEAQREHDTRFRVLMEATRDAVVFVALGTGRILEANSVAASLLGATVDELRGAAFAQEFEAKRRGEFMSNLTSSAIAETTTPMELQARRSRKRLLVTPSVFRAAGERMLFARLENAEEAEQTSDELTENLAALYQEGVDAIVFTDRDGIIRAANEAFLNLTDVAHVTMVKGKSLADFLVRGVVDTKVLIENAARTGHMRLYATKIESEYGSQVSVEISATYLNDRAKPSLVFVIRDASRAEAVRKSGGAVTDDGVKSVMELVGSATLKDIVSETTDVVEKMCIETAVELTNNNRVAAAEMLGLSRQSLYVKLRKYGLLSKETD